MYKKEKMNKKRNRKKKNKWSREGDGGCGLREKRGGRRMNRREIK